MSKIFIQYDENFNIMYVHNMPFDKYYGLGKSQKQLLEEGALVTSWNEMTNIPEGKNVVYKYNQETNSVYGELYDILPQEPSVEDKISILELGLANAEYSLMMGGLL